MTDSQCRFCLEDIDPDDCGSSLFDKRLRLAMAGVFSFEIPFRRDLPMYTCERCSWIVMDFHDYCKAVQKNQEKLEQEFNLDDEFEIDENLPMESNDTDDSKEEAASSTDCEASNSIEPEYSADDNIHLSPVAITSAIMPDEDDDWEDDVEVAYEFNPDFESVNCEETSESEEQLSISSQEHKIPSSSEEAVKTLESEDSHATHNSVNASISNEEAPDPSFDQPETEPKKKCLRRSSRFTTQSKSSASSNNRVLERKHKSVGETSHHTPNTANAAEHVCDLCGKSFLCKSKLRQHARCHKFVECPVCKKTLIGRTLKVHIAAHEGAFRCDVCDKTCASKQNLELHKDTQHPSEDGAKYSCDQCDKSFFTKSHLRDHQRYHQLVNCPVCKKSLPKQKLRQHIAAHEGAFRCGVCEKLFSSKSKLNYHENSQHPLTLRTD